MREKIKTKMHQRRKHPVAKKEARKTVRYLP